MSSEVPVRVQDPYVFTHLPDSFEHLTSSNEVIITVNFAHKEELVPGVKAMSRTKLVAIHMWEIHFTVVLEHLRKGESIPDDLEIPTSQRHIRQHEMDNRALAQEFVNKHQNNQEGFKKAFDYLRTRYERIPLLIRRAYFLIQDSH